MFKFKFLPFILFLFSSFAWGVVNHPFPQSLIYSYGIKPNNVSQNVMNNRVSSLYDDWKNNYVDSAGTDGSGHQMYRINCSKDTSGDTVSEGQGYGMLIAVVMAGYDANAQNIYDGLYWFFNAHKDGNGLMVWYVDPSGNETQGSDNATDGDLDIALSLIMADAQWGSSGAINYKQEAQNLVTALMNNNVDTAGYDGGAYEDNDWSIRPGDWWLSDSQHLTRSSDFLTSHFKIFAQFWDSNWTNVASRCYDIISTIQANDSPSSGLLPDFAYTTTGRAVSGYVLEGSHDGDYHYNACRDPWRISIDYLFTGDTRSKNSMSTIASFIDSDTGTDPDSVVDGYYLNGNGYGSDYGWGAASEAFVAPFGVAGMVDASHQSWLNAAFDFTTTHDYNQGYYEDSIRLLSSLVMSGNWWNPLVGAGIPTTVLVSPGDNASLGNTTVLLEWQDKSIAGVDLYQLDVSTNSNFSTHLSGYPKNLAVVTQTLTNLNYTTYYWKVACSTNAGGNWGDWAGPSDFTIGGSTEIDYFEQNPYAHNDPYNPTNLLPNKLNGYWYCVDDSGDPFSGNAKHSRSLSLTVTNDAADGTTKSLFTSYTLGVSDAAADGGNGVWAYWELDCTLSSNDAEQDLTGKTVNFWIKGNTNRNMRLVLGVSATKASSKYGDDLYSAVFPVTTSWQLISLAIKSNTFQQAGWGTAVPFSSCVTEVVAFAFSEDTPESGNTAYRDFTLDQVYFSGAGSSSIPVASLIKPNNGQVFVNEGNSVTCQWSDESANGVSKYQFDISDKNDFSTHLTGYPTEITGNFLTINNLGDQVDYYWRVRCAVTGTNWGNWSSVYKFAVFTNTVSFFAIDLFEQNNRVVSTNPYSPNDIKDNNLEGFWYCNDDSQSGTFTFGSNTTTTLFEILTNNGADGSAKNLHVAYKLGVSSASHNEWGSWELNTTLSSNEQEKNLSNMIIDFWMKGSTNYNLKLTLSPNLVKSTTKYSNDLYFVSVPVTTAWKHYSYRVDSTTFHQAGWGPSVSSSEAFAEVVALTWAEDAPESGARKNREIWLDEVKMGPNYGFLNASDIVISEVMANPAQLGDAYGEWIEVYNKGDVTVTLNNDWIIGDLGATHNRFTLNGSLDVKPHQYAILSKYLLNSSGVNFEQTWGNNDDIWGDAAEENYNAVDYDSGANMANADGVFIYHKPSGYIAAINFSATSAHSIEARRPDSYIVSSDTNAPTDVSSDTNWNLCNVRADTNGYTNSTDYGTPGHTNSQYEAPFVPTPTPPQITGITVFETNDGSGKVIIRYTGIDANNDLCTYTNAQYSTDNATWNNMTPLSSDSRHTAEPLPFTLSGANITFVWDSKSDLPNTYDGTVWIRLQVNDGASNSIMSNSGSFVIDNKVPNQVTVISPSDNIWTNDNTPAFSWNAGVDDSTITNYKIVVGIATNVVVGTSFTPSTLSDGMYNWQVCAVDVYGNQGTWSVARTIKIDSTAPTQPNLVSPISNSMTNSPVTLQWNASSETGSGIAYYKVDVDDISYSFGSIAKTTNVVATAVSLSFSVGSYYWRVRAYDNAGNVSSYQSWNFSVATVDTNPPSVPTLLSPSDNVWTNDNTPTFVWNASTDADSGVAGYDIVIDGVTNSTTGTSYTPSTVLSEGNNMWMVRAKDNAGNKSAFSSSRTIKIDTTGPSTLTLLSPADSAQLSDPTPTLTWTTANDGTGVGVAGYQIIIDSTTNTSISTNYVSGVLSDGNHSWKVRAYDSLGNYGNFSTSQTFLIDTLPPDTVLLSSPVSNSTIANINMTLMWNASSDSGSGLDKYIVQFDDNSGFVSPMTKTTNGISWSVTGLVNGTTNYWRVRAYDFLGHTNAWSSTWTVIIDTNQIIPILHFPGNGDYLNNTTPTFSWSKESDVTNYQIVVDNVTNTIGSSSTNYTSGVLADGVHLWKVRAYKQSTSQWQSWTGTRTVNIDTTGPSTPSLLTPANGTYLSDVTPSFVWNASTDTGVGVASYDIVIDNTTNNVSTTNYSPGSALSDGSHTWKVRAVDTLGNKGGFSSRTINIDTTGPSIPVLLNPSNNVWTNDNTPNFAWNASTDTGVGVASYDIVIDNTTNNVSITNYIPGSTLFDGSHMWKVRAVDVLGNKGSFSSSWNIKIDTTNPSMPSLSLPTDGAVTNDNTPTLTWNASTDADSGIAGYNVVINNTTNYVTGTSYTSGLLGDGIYMWQVCAIDNANNRSSYSNRTLQILTATIPTTPTLLSPANSSAVNSYRPTFVWNSVAGATGYIIVINNVTNRIGNTNFAPSSDLNDGNNSWMVAATNTAGYSAFTSMSVVNIDTMSPTAPSVVLADGKDVVTSVNVHLKFDKTYMSSDVVGFYISETNNPPSSTSSMWVPVIPDEFSYTITDVEGSHTVYIWVIDNAGNVSSSKSVSFTYKEDNTGLKKNQFKVSPNPFRRSDGVMNIIYNAEVDADVKFEVYTLVGTLVKTITPKTLFEAEWNGKNDNENEVASGIYFMIMKVDDKVVYHPLKIGYIRK